MIDMQGQIESSGMQQTDRKVPMRRQSCIRQCITRASILSSVSPSSFFLFFLLLRLWQLHLSCATFDCSFQAMRRWITFPEHLQLDLQRIDVVNALKMTTSLLSHSSSRCQLAFRGSSHRPGLKRTPISAIVRVSANDQHAERAFDWKKAGAVAVLSASLCLTDPAW